MSKFEANCSDSSALWVRAYAELRVELENQRLAALNAHTRCDQLRSLIHQIKLEVDTAMDSSVIKKAVQRILDNDYKQVSSRACTYEVVQE